MRTGPARGSEWTEAPLTWSTGLRIDEFPNPSIFQARAAQGNIRRYMIFVRNRIGLLGARSQNAEGIALGSVDYHANH